MGVVDIMVWLRVMDIYDYDICDGLVHVVGDVSIYDKKLKKIPVQFGYVSGNFYCGYNRLTSLEGCPNEVGGDFDCSGNQLTSLEGCPVEVGGKFDCRFNGIKGKPDVSGIIIGGPLLCGW